MKKSFFRARMNSKFIIFPILSELYCPGLQASCVNISVTSGTQTITNPTINNSGCSDDSGIGYSAATGGSLIINNNSPDNANYINTGGTNTYAVQSLDDGSITINGGGIFSLIDGYGDIVFNSMGNGAIITATNSTLIIAGDYATGLQADSGGTINGNNLTVNVSSNSATDFARGAYASGSSSMIALIGGSVQTNVLNSGYGLYANSNGTITTSNVAINVATTTTSGEAFGAYADGATIHLMDGSSVQASGGTRSHGLDALYLGEISANNLTVTVTSSNTAFGVYTYAGTINLQGGSIQANGTNYADGLNAQGGGTITANNINVTANGNTSYGATVSGTGSMLSLTNSAITISGESAFGLVVDIGGTIVGSNITVNSTGLGAAVTNGSSLSLTDSTITANRGNAIIARGGQVGNVNTIMVHGGSLNSLSADLIKADTTVSNITLNTVTTGANGSNNLLSITNDSMINFTAEQNSNLTGNIMADTDSVAHINFNNSLFTGAINGGQINTALNTSTWNVTADSMIATLSNIGAINFSPVGNFKTITVTDAYTGGGSIIFNTYLNQGGAASMTDTLIADSTSGNTTLLVNNKGGPGALTGNGPTDGIKLITVTGGAAASNGLFVLEKPVIAGPYEYTLSKSDSINWYLKSTLDVVIDPKSPNRSAIPNYRQETSLYSTLPSMAALYGRTLLDTLDERSGVQTILASLSGDAKVMPSAFWGRVLGEQGLHNGGHNGIYSKAGARFNYNIGGLQAGIDLYRNEGKDYAGIYGAVGQIKGDVTHFTNVKAGWNQLDAYTTGGYWTHYGMAGWYLDGLIQGTWYDTKATSIRPLQLKTNGFDLITSLEGGYPFKLSNSLAIEPQAQVVYQNIGLNNARDPSAKVHFHNTNYTAARIGARFSRGWIIDKRKNGDAPRLTAWLRPSLWREFQGNAITSFSSETGFIPFTSDLGGNWAEITGGVTADIKQNTRFYASLGYDIGFTDNNKNHAYNGKIGFKRTW